ncbi:MAG: hypothetical protein F6K23_37870 [Okeania sp. SIO2C9]|uniref:hypothetical protein n=1 Tax=Okeania sp. SIO2C9 TaxID=2607791 RepID=UPI0013BEE28E|nr:hypothetical protein [Okeania sp. SIO2C9]NEQ78257.1 hypothetical protein [Okeania sp. SIO2C9]
MKINIDNDYEIVQEVFQILLEHLETSKVMRFWSICKLGHGDYLELKDKLFAGETVDSLYEKIKAFQDEKLANSEVNND